MIQLDEGQQILPSGQPWTKSLIAASVVAEGQALPGGTGGAFEWLEIGPQPAAWGRLILLQILQSDGGDRCGFGIEFI